MIPQRGSLSHYSFTILPGAKTYVSCAVQKDAGDGSGYHQRDPGLCKSGGVFYFSVRTGRAAAENREIPASDHPGRRDRCGSCHQAGLSQNVGEAAINPVPRAMILREAEEAAQEYDYEGGLKLYRIRPPGGGDREENL